MIEIVDPTKAYIIGHENRLEAIQRWLTYNDKKVEFQISKLRSNKRWIVQAKGQEHFNAQLEALKAQREVSLLMKDDKGHYTYSGLAAYLADQLETTVENRIVVPEPALIPWNKKASYPMYGYQEQAVQALLKVRHGGVELATGLGKSFIIVNLLKELGLPALIMTPSSSISEQLFEELTERFGPSKVGAFFEGKKKFDKLFVVANGQSLVRLEPDSPAYRHLSTYPVFISDESHCTPAATFQKVCFGVSAKASYRFFFSATQLRNDGADLLLNGITGPIVQKMSLHEGVNGGYLTKPNFFMVQAFSKDSYDVPGKVNEMTRHHLYYNPAVNKAAADLANRSVRLMGHRVLILVEEMEQFAKLLPMFEYEARFAHGGVTADNKDKLPEKYWDSDPKALVKAFDNGEFPILVGTSCISTGTNIRSVRTLIYLQGGQSEIQVRQAIGRATRLYPGKEFCNIFDFDIQNKDCLHRHARVRKSIYNDLYPNNCKEISL